MRKNWEEHLRNPPPGSRAFEAKEFGIDMEELIANLKLTPAERIKKLDRQLNEDRANGIDYDRYPAWDLSRRPK